MRVKELSVEVDERVLKRAEAVFDKLGINTSTAINVFLTQVAIEEKIPFDSDLLRARTLGVSDYSFEKLFAALVKEEIAAAKAKGLPVALYDVDLKKPYLEYPDGRREYELSK